MKIFNNSNIIAKGWYIACPSHEIPPKKAKSFTICGQRIVIFRGEDNKIRALDAYCPHLGTDLGIGKVESNFIRCFFHHWAFDENGKCQHIPCQSSIPEKAKLQAYTTTEKYNFIWIYPGTTAPEPVAEFDELSDKELAIIHGKAFTRNCHHHICMMNGIDAQHLQTVHKFDIDMQLTLTHNPPQTVVDFTLTGKFKQTNYREKIAYKILGETYSYTMRYAHGCIGLLTMMKNVKLLPPLHMIYAYTPIAPNKTRIQLIYLTAKRTGIFGQLKTKILLLLTRLGYYLLRGEDGKIYDNIRFNPNAILSIDAPLVKYMNYVNKLEPSIWSNAWEPHQNDYKPN